jgi:hypothetical protein
VFEYGATSTANGRATITGTPANRAIFRMATVTDAPPRNAAASATNFNHAQPYSWVIIRPGTVAGFNTANDPAQFTNFATVNTVAQINITDASTGLDVPLTAANLNGYLRFDDSLWQWDAAVPVSQRGTFGFALLPDTLGTPNRVIALTYTPVPEPAFALLLAAAAAVPFLRTCHRAARGTARL